jgi:hypothetical protein
MPPDVIMHTRALTVAALDGKAVGSFQRVVLGSAAVSMLPYDIAHSPERSVSRTSSGRRLRCGRCPVTNLTPILPEVQPSSRARAVFLAQSMPWDMTDSLCAWVARRDNQICKFLPPSQYKTCDHTQSALHPSTAHCIWTVPLPQATRL